MKKITLCTGLILLMMLFALQLPAFGSPQAALTAEPEAFNSITGSTSFNYTLGDVSNSSVIIKIYNAQGTVVRTFDEGVRSSGTYSITWDGRDDNNNAVPEGIYRASLSASTGSGSAYHSINILGGVGTGVGQFSAPKGLAVVSAGNIIVADYNNNRIQKYDSSTWSVLGNFDANVSTGFNLPYGVAAGLDGSIYAADTFHNRVLKLGSSGWNVFATGTNFNNVTKSLVRPYGVAVDPEGYVYVLDSVNNRVVKFSPSGEPLLEWGGGNFMMPSGIAAGTSGIYVIHFAYINNVTQRQIHRFSNQGELLTWNPGTNLNNPSALTVDGSGNVYVAYAAGSADHRIVKFGPNGEFITEWGSNGTGVGQLGESYGIAVDPAGNVYVSESSNYRIQVFGPPSGGQQISTEATLLVDNTPPEIAIQAPAGEYLLNQTGITASWDATDSLSGIATISGTPVGSPIDTSQVGNSTFTVTAVDKAGNSSTKTADYGVHYVFSGVLSPIKSDGTSIFKLGSTIPVKFRLTDVNGISVGNAIATLDIIKTKDSVPTGVIEVLSTCEASTGSNFRYDSDGAQYIYNLSTDNLTTGTWRLKITLDDGTTKYQDINLR